jgi:biopolymer transport protein ExbD
MAEPFGRDEGFSEISEVNVVPLADVSLVLLIILLLLTPMMAQSMLHVRTAGRDAAPQNSAPRDPSPARELVLLVDLDPGGIAVGEALFASTAELSAFLRLELARRADRKVFLSPHPDVPHGAVVSAIEAIQAAGASAVALVQTADPVP